MNVFHGSDVPVPSPRIRLEERYMDFGAGFYTTSNLQQAERWADKVAKRRMSSTRCVSVYEIDMEKAKRELVVVRFTQPDEEWLDFVCRCRNGTPIGRSYDMVMGPVADDKVYETVVLYENGIYSKEETLLRLKIEKQFDQILFHTETALQLLRFTNVLTPGEYGNG